MSDKLAFLEVSETIFRALPIITLSFTCQMNLFPLIKVLQHPTRTRVRQVIYGQSASSLLPATVL